MQKILIVTIMIQLGASLAMADSAIDAEVRRLADETISAPTPEGKHEAAAKIGELGQKAIPELRRLLQSDDWLKQSQAFNGIGALGSGAAELVPDIVVALNDKSRFTRVRAASSLGQIGWTARSAVPKLIASIDDDDLPTRVMAIVALAQIGAEPSIVVPAIMRNLDGPEDFPKGTYMKKYSVSSLGKFGEDAQQSVPKLLELAKTTRKAEIKSAIDETLEQIGSISSAPAQGFSEQLFIACNNKVQGNIKIKRGWQGANSKIETNSVYRIVSEREWADLWRRHGRRAADCPKIDFSKDMIVAIFIGRSANIDDLKLDRGEIANGRANLSISYMRSDAYDMPGHTKFLIIQMPWFGGTMQVESAWVRAMSDGNRHNQTLASFLPLK